jgi:hypothetical protein
LQQWTWELQALSCYPVVLLQDAVPPPSLAHTCEPRHQRHIMVMKCLPTAHLDLYKNNAQARWLKLVFRRRLVQISASTMNIQRDSSWFSSVPSGECWGSSDRLLLPTFYPTVHIIQPTIWFGSVCGIDRVDK